jgi:transcriptional regulator of acetoin/glycerol metabolism
MLLIAFILSEKFSSSILKKGKKMFRGKLMQEQIKESGVRIGDSCCIYPSEGKKKAFTLNRYCIDLVSTRYRPENLSMSYFELGFTPGGNFHYRLELDEKVPEVGRFLLKTIHGKPFWINGMAAREAYVERSDRLYIEDHKLNFNAYGLEHQVASTFENPILQMTPLVQSDLNMLLLGETGTGKSYLAKKIHQHSNRSGEFIAVNLSSFNPMLIESELFGHKKGAFTGAVQDRLGAIALADHGTLFLDEIDSLPMNIQTKLLTFLDDKQYRRVGDASLHQIKTRFIFAAGRSLEPLVEQGLFRRDFYYRLKSGHTINLPSLRDAPKRITEACKEYGIKNGVSFSDNLLSFYQTLAWPGNLRQLLGHLDKKKIISRSKKIDFDEVDEQFVLQSSNLMSINENHEFMTMEQCKLNHLKKTLAACDGNISLTARKLSMSEKTVKNLTQKINSPERK